MKRSITFLIIITLAIAAMCVPANAYSQKKAKAPEPKGEIKLTYNFPEGKPLSYTNITNMAQTMDFNGQTMQVNIQVLLSSTFTGKGKTEDNIKIEVLIDTMKQTVDSPQGSAGGLMNDAMGKTFTMTLSPLGKEVDLSDAEKISIATEGGVQTTAGQSFMEYFPDLPANAIKPGDTWVTNDTIDKKSSSFSIRTVTKAENKFEGMEQVDGYDCVKITSVISGTREQTAQTMGMDVATSGTFAGTSVLWFAVKEGYYIKNTSIGKLTGNIEVSGPQNMSMPMVADITTVSALKK
jgi:hypothetical protein